MKSVSIFLLYLLLPVIAFGQEDFDRIRDPEALERIRAAHAAYVTERLELSSSEAERFWPVYRTYNEKRREIRQEMRNERRSGDDEETILKRQLELKQKELDLEKEYTEKLSNIIPAGKVVKLRQAEADFRKLLLQQIQQRRRQRR